MCHAPMSLTQSAVLATTHGPGPPIEVPGSLRRVAGLVAELLALVSIVFVIPFVILAIGTPIALCVRLLLWIIGVL